MSGKPEKVMMEGANYNHERAPIHARRIRFNAYTLTSLLFTLQNGEVEAKGDKIPPGTKVLRSFMGWDGCFNIVLESPEFTKVFPNQLIPELNIVVGEKPPK
jgi:hypothetical protein